jgi:hypothetical protein
MLIQFKFVEKRGDGIKKKSSPLKLLANLNQTLLK